MPRSFTKRLMLENLCNRRPFEGILLRNTRLDIKESLRTSPFPLTILRLSPGTHFRYEVQKLQPIAGQKQKRLRLRKDSFLFYIPKRRRKKRIHDIIRFTLLASSDDLRYLREQRKKKKRKDGRELSVNASIFFPFL